MPVRFDQLYLMPNFIEQLNKLSRQERALRRKVGRLLEHYGEDCSRLKRSTLNASRRRVWHTEVGYSKRMIDEPLEPSLPGSCAILHVGHHDEANSWGENYDAETIELIRQHRMASLTPTVAKSQVHATRAESGDATRLHDSTTVTYGKYLTQKELLRLGVPKAQARQIRALLRVDGLSNAGVAVALEEKLENLVAAKLAGSVFPIPVPGYGAPRPIAVAPADVSSLFRLPLHKFLATMSEEQQKLARRQNRNLYVIRGAAGSGKTVIGVRRVEHLLALRGLFDKRPILFTCYNQVLRGAVQQMIEDTMGAPLEKLGVVVKTVYDLLSETEKELKLHKGAGKRSLDKLQPLLSTARKDVSEGRTLASWTDAAILAEINEVIFGRAIERQEDYVATDRTGRGRPMDARARGALWLVYERFRKECELQQVTLWSHLPARLAAHFERHPLKAPKYSAMIIDEVQDLSPASVRALLALQAGVTDDILILGDAAQSVYQTGFRWKHLGLQVFGSQVSILRACFRSTPPIVRAASPLVAGQRDMLEEDLVLPEVGYDGDAPLIRLAIFEDKERVLENTALAVAERIQDGVPPSSIAVLIDSAADRRELANKLAELDCAFEEVYKPGGKKSINIFESSVKLLSTYSAKGLEFQVVFIPLVTESQFPTRDVPPEVGATSRRALFTAMVRCGWELHLYAPRNEAAVLLGEIERSVVLEWPSELA